MDSVMTTENTLTQREEILNDVFTTAIEGGINYWCTVRSYRWSDGPPDYNQVADFRAEIMETEADEHPEHVIDAAVIALGVRRAFEHLQALRKAGVGIYEYQWRAIRDLHFGKYDDVDYDADTADIIVQFGLFGELVYA